MGLSVLCPCCRSVPLEHPVGLSMCPAWSHVSAVCLSVCGSMGETWPEGAVGEHKNTNTWWWPLLHAAMGAARNSSRSDGSVCGMGSKGLPLGPLKLGHLPAVCCPSGRIPAHRGAWLLELDLPGICSPKQALKVARFPPSHQLSAEGSRPFPVAPGASRRHGARLRVSPTFNSPSVLAVL